MFLFHSHWEKGQSTSGIVGLSLPQSTWWKKQIAAEFFKDFSLQMNSSVGVTISTHMNKDQIKVGD